MTRSYSETEIRMGDFEMKRENPQLFQKISNDNILFVFLESGYNEKSDKEGKLWITPRSNMEEFKKIVSKFDDLLTFEETTLSTIMALENMEFINSDGNEMEPRYWLTMMNYATTEREPEKQFCLMPKGLSENIMAYKNRTSQEKDLMAELAKTQFRMEELKESLIKMSENREENVNYEEKAVDTNPNDNETEEISSEINMDGEKYKIIFRKAAM
jgi:hypothetical protein